MKRTFMAFTGFGITAALLVLSSCKKDNNNTNPTYTVPATYTFDNADSLTAKTTLSMIAEIEAAINFGNTSGNVVSNTKLKGMFANTGGYFTDATNATFTANAIDGLVPAYSVMDLTAEYRYDRHFSLSASVNNFTNTRYFTRRADSYPGPGIVPSDARSFYLTIQARF